MNYGSLLNSKFKVQGSKLLPVQRIAFSQILKNLAPAQTLVLYGLGPRALSVSVMSVTVSANFWASDEEIHSSRKRSGSSPKSSNIKSTASALPWAFTLPSR